MSDSMISIEADYAGAKLATTNQAVQVQRSLAGSGETVRNINETFPQLVQRQFKGFNGRKEALWSMESTTPLSPLSERTELMLNYVGFMKWQVSRTDASSMLEMADIDISKSAYGTSFGLLLQRRRDEQFSFRKGGFV